MSLPLLNDTSGIFLASTVPGTDTLSTALQDSTNTTATDISNEDGAEVAFNIVDKIYRAVKAYNDGHDTDLAKVTASVSSSVSGNEMTRTYVLAFKLDVDTAGLDVANEPS